MEVKDLEQRIQKCSFLLKTLIKRWDELGNPASETATYKMVKEALGFLEGRFNEEALIEVDIDNDTFMKIALMAHEQNITFNQVVEQALRLQAEKDIAEHEEANPPDTEM
jgi:hypothetical protein